MYMHLVRREVKFPERIFAMRILIFLLLVLVVGAGLLTDFGKYRGAGGNVDNTQSGSSRPELDYLKAVNSAGPPKDPQLLFLLMGAYANATRQVEGAEFFSARLNEFASRLSDPQKSLYPRPVSPLPPHPPSPVPF